MNTDITKYFSEDFLNFLKNNETKKIESLISRRGYLVGNKESFWTINRKCIATLLYNMEEIKMFFKFFRKYKVFQNEKYPKNFIKDILFNSLNMKNPDYCFLMKYFKNFFDKITIMTEVLPFIEFCYSKKNKNSIDDENDLYKKMIFKSIEKRGKLVFDLL